MSRYKLELEFESDFPEDLVTRQIENHIDSAISNYCLQGTEVNCSSIRVHTHETITLSKDKYEELVKCSNYVYHWGNRVATCKKCGNLNPGHGICASCGYDDSDNV